MKLILILLTLAIVIAFAKFTAHQILFFLEKEDDDSNDSDDIDTNDVIKMLAIEDILKDEPINYIAYDKTFKELTYE